MFRTEYLEGRLRYETEQVVCFDVYLNSNIAKDFFVCQALLSLVNRRIAHNSPSEVVYYNTVLNGTTIFVEIQNGIHDYITIRKNLALDPVFLT